MQEDNRFWRIRMNFKLHEIIGKADTLKFIKTQQIIWLGLIHRMDSNRRDRIVTQWNPSVTAAEEEDHEGNGLKR